MPTMKESRIIVFPKNCHINENMRIVFEQWHSLNFVNARLYVPQMPANSYTSLSFSVPSDLKLFVRMFSLYPFSGFLQQFHFPV